MTPLVEPLSLDEAYLDVTENAWGETLGQAVAQRLKAEIKAATSLTASAGVAPNKFLAKIASAWRKPDGLTVIAPERMEQFLQKLPVDALWGVGPVTADAAARARHQAARRRPHGGSGDAEGCRRQSAQTGCGASPTASTTGPSSPEYEPKSSGSENTFADDLTDITQIQRGNRRDGARRGSVARARRSCSAAR